MEGGLLPNFVGVLAIWLSSLTKKWRVLGWTLGMRKVELVPPSAFSETQEGQVIHSQATKPNGKKAADHRMWEGLRCNLWKIGTAQRKGSDEHGAGVG